MVNNNFLLKKFQGEFYSILEFCVTDFRRLRKKISELIKINLFQPHETLLFAKLSRLDLKF
jgi:hypothetical protein